MDTGRRQAKVGLVDPFPRDKSCSQDQNVRGPLMDIYFGLKAKRERNPQGREGARSQHTMRGAERIEWGWTLQDARRSTSANLWSALRKCPLVPFHCCRLLIGYRKKLNDDPHPYYTMLLRSSGGDDVIDLSFDSVKV